VFRLRQAGINASTMYTRGSYNALQSFCDSHAHYPQTEYLADRILNLPTHPYVRQDDLCATVTAFNSVLGRRTAAIDYARASRAVQ
jgi:dTDP-4-amino-4,6-dideoxygalactose transaminase